MYDPYFKEMENTIVAGYWELRFAKWFGKKHTGHDGYFSVTMYKWRGKLYLTDFKET